MVKFTILLIAVFALQATLAGPVTKNDSSKHFFNKLDKARGEALLSIQNLSLDNVERRRAIVSHASEFAYNIEQAINKIFKNFVRVNEKYSHGSLPQIALHLNNVVHQVQEILIAKPTQLKTTLTDNIHKIYTATEKLIKIWVHFKENSDVGQMESDIKGVIEKLIDALDHLKIHGKFYNQTYAEINKSHQNIADLTINTLEKIQCENSETLDLLTKAGQNFLRSLRKINHHIEDEMVKYNDSKPDKLKSVSMELHKIKSRLEEVLKRHDSDNVKRQITDLKTQIRLTIHDFDTEVQKLVEIGKTYEKDDKYMSIDNSVRNCISDCVHAEQGLLWRLDGIRRLYE